MDSNKPPNLKKKISRSDSSDRKSKNRNRIIDLDEPLTLLNVNNFNSKKNKIGRIIDLNEAFTLRLDNKNDIIKIDETNKNRKMLYISKELQTLHSDDTSSTVTIESPQSNVKQVQSTTVASSMNVMHVNNAAMQSTSTMSNIYSQSNVEMKLIPSKSNSRVIDLEDIPKIDETNKYVRKRNLEDHLHMTKNPKMQCTIRQSPTLHSADILSTLAIKCPQPNVKQIKYPQPNVKQIQSTTVVSSMNMMHVNNTAMQSVSTMPNANFQSNIQMHRKFIRPKSNSHIIDLEESFTIHNLQSKHLRINNCLLQNNDEQLLLNENREIDLETPLILAQFMSETNTANFIVQSHYIGEMIVLCKHCGAKHFQQEKVSSQNSFDDCCNHGKVILNPMKEFPKELKALFEGSHEKSKEFFRNIRRYNSKLSFASFNANVVNFNNRRPGPFCFKIQGQIYYQINTTLRPQIGEEPSYGQLFIYDGEEASKFRLSNSNLDSELMKMLDCMMRNCNIFAQTYMMMHEELKLQEFQAIQENREVPELQLAFTVKEGLDPRRYNVQRSNEVAAIFTTNADGEIPDTYIVIRNKDAKDLKRINSMHPNVEPWTYPLFYPHGSIGWHTDILKINSNRKVTRLNYVRYQIAIRENEFNAFLRGSRLFQQYIVDSYVKIERDRINWCNSHQKELRAESYQGLIDYVNSMESNLQKYRIGKIVILPSTFIGSPRNMIQKYQDSMAITRKYGKPDLFITMTCNPNWREIKENLLPGQQTSDRPDLCARVFNIKKDALLDMIIKEKMIGTVVAYVYTIEFQKRGLPHMHLLITLDSKDKIRTIEQVDRFLSAEIPDPSENPLLHKLVMKHMIHGPCGDWCIKDGKCSKHFPKPYQNETSIDANNYPQYRRKDNGKFFERPNNYLVNNQYVVPYCPILLQMFDCHMNTEVVSRITAVKYLFKYVLKGHDAAAITISEKQNDLMQVSNNTPMIIDHDEVKMYVESRYVSPIEACWRIFSLPLYKKSHTVIRLPVHLPNQQTVLIHNDPEETSVENMINQTTMLLDYFALNARDQNAKKYTYVQIPQHYTFKITKKNGKNIRFWETRKGSFNCIGRMYSISPSSIELFHLRLLLLNKKGATSFEDLRTVDNIHYDTFVQTCLALHLIEDNEEWTRALKEAAFWMMPRQLRRLFVRILIYCNPLNPKELWNSFKLDMSVDFKQSMSLELAQRRAFSSICTMLQNENHPISDFYDDKNTLQNNGDQILDYESVQLHLQKGQNMYYSLNNEQKCIVDTILNIILHNEDIDCDRCFFIKGPGGSGKTFIYNTLFHLLMGKEKQVCTMAFTGIAATLLPFGKTVHKTFGLPVPLFSDSTTNIKCQSMEAERLKNIDLFIWDEAPMAPRYALEVVDRTLKDLMQKDVPFGGKVFLLGGDFRQLLPVQRNATRSEIINLSIKNSKLWKYFTIFDLKQNMRTLSTEIEFKKFLINLGDGILNDLNNNVDISNISDQCIASNNEDIVETTYGFILRNKKYRDAINFAILSSRNEDVDEINKKVIDLLDKDTEKIYTSIDNSDNCDNGALNESLLPEYLNTLSPLSLPPYELRLRKYSVVMLIRNLSIDEGLCNGTRLLVLEMSDNLLKCEILTGDKTGEIVFLSRITLYSENDYPFTFKRRQFPIKAAFAMTINKAQGQTFERISIDLRRDVFSHGQLYVAFSRVRSWDSIKIYISEEALEKKSIKNYVYKELFT